MVAAQMTEQQKRAFWDKVNIRQDAKQCWEWTGAKKPKGYGNVRINKRYTTAHRVAWELANNMDIPEGMLVMHLCDNPQCCNPAHLVLGTLKNNTADMLLKGRVNRVPIAVGERHGNAKMKNADIQTIMNMLARGDSQSTIAKRFNVVQTTISKIKLKKSWRHIYA